MSLLEFSIVSGVIVAGLFVWLSIKRQKNMLILPSISLGICFGLIVHLIGYEINDHNITSLSHYNNFNKIELVEVNLNSMFGNYYDFIVTYDDSSTCKVTINYEEKGPYKKKTCEIYIKNYNGELLYCNWHKTDVDDWNEMKEMFIDKFNQKEIESVYKTKKSITKQL